MLEMPVKSTAIFHYITLNWKKLDRFANVTLIKENLPEESLVLNECMNHYL